MWGRGDSGESTERATRRQSALTRDLESLSSSAPDHAGAMAGAATATSHTRTPDIDLDHQAAEQSGAVSIRQPSAAAQAAPLQLGGNVTHYAPNSLHLGAYGSVLLALKLHFAVCLTVPADSGLTQHIQVSSPVCSLARQARRRSLAPSSTGTRAQRRRRRRRARRPCRHMKMSRR